MINPIISEIARVAPDVVLTGQQIRAADRAKNPDAVAATVEGQFTSIKRMFAERLGLSDIPDNDIVRRMILTTAVTSLDDMPSSWLLEIYQPIDSFNLGCSTARQLGLLELMYTTLLRRPADGAGFKHYSDMIDNGVPYWQVVQYIELSPEAVSNRVSDDQK